MAYKEKTIEKLYWSIGEVAEQLGVNTSLIRYWEKEFGTLRPKRTGKGDRSYTKKDIEQLQRIQHLVKEKGFTLQGAREQLRKVDEVESTGPLDMEGLRDRLLEIRTQLVTLRENVQ
ncbi:MAG: MerR family transcriptional regulator [Flavobacteriales bacterium]|jgi:DNA-binding transcriptional MerR regulator|nr:MerR family transcriptional regulator [Flavobacteriales bacterium]MBK6551204.1 MerR family transcriptional regulator [Flavobacteriales bacterium]MBK6884774.1 MerR family transcriptional regulator [Flavobacteriales bacterium]MBK7102094.1 MerR family transcriptional regulator [Flavobacteriales bacterium]MBK7112564.1 MerR family transcriptional regulator [Flavobacteriales bacterium]